MCFSPAEPFIRRANSNRHMTLAFVDFLLLSVMHMDSVVRRFDYVLMECGSNSYGPTKFKHRKCLHEIFPGNMPPKSTENLWIDLQNFTEILWAIFQCCKKCNEMFCVRVLSQTDTVKRSKMCSIYLHIYEFVGNDGQTQSYVTHSL